MVLEIDQLRGRVSNAERLRVGGDRAGVLKSLDFLDDLDMNDFVSFDGSLQSVVLAAMRLRTAVFLSQSRSSLYPKARWGIEMALKSLEETGEMIQTLEASEVSGSLRKGPFMEPYNHTAEHFRDRAQWCLIAASVSANPVLLNDAIDYFDQAMQAATDKEGIYWLSKWEQTRLQRELKEEVSIQGVNDAYTSLAEILVTGGEWGRLAAVSAIQYLDTRASDKEIAAQAYADYLTAISVDRNSSKVLRKEQLKRQTRPLRSSVLRVSRVLTQIGERVVGVVGGEH